MENDASSYKKTAAVGIGIAVLFTILIIIHYRQISNRSGTIIIPAGGTYLGPTVQTVTGHIYPYTFDVPNTVTLVTFPNDPYDMYALSGDNPSSNILIGIDDLKKNTERSAYINQPKTAYINNWWKQFSSLTGVGNIQPFTNSKGLKGYTVKFLNTAGQSPNVDVFFEVHGHPEYVIHLSNGTLDPSVFTKIVDSVGWETQ